MKSSTRTLLTVGASLIAVLAANPAAAQDAAAPAADARAEQDLGDIVVTAQRREESINDVGMSIQALTSDTLEDLRVTSVRDLTAVVPSFTVAQSYQGVPTYTMRGIGFNTINLSATSTVGTYVDEVAYAYPIMNTGPLIDIERVEVLKGPQGTLYGRNTTAGLINFITGRPTEEFTGGLSIDVGNYQTLNAGGFLSGALGDGVQARIAFRTENSGQGWQISNSRGERLGEVERFGVRLTVAIQPTATTEVELAATYWINDSDTVAGQGIGFTPATTPGSGSLSALFNAPGIANYIANNRPTRGSQADWQTYAGRSADIGTGLGLDNPLRENNEFIGLRMRITQELGDTLRFVSLTSYNEFDRDATFDWSGVPAEILSQHAIGRINSFGQEARIEGETGPVTWLIGGYYARDTLLDSNRTLLGQNANVSLVRFVGSTLLGTPFNSAGYTPTQMAQAFRTYEDVGNFRTTTWSIFGNADIELNDQFKLTLGARYTEDEQDYAGCSRDFNGNMLPNVNVFNRAFFFNAYGQLAPQISQGQCNTYNADTNQFGLVQSVLAEDNFAWRVALNYEPNSDTLLYASVSRGAKAGTTPVNAASMARSNAPVRQEFLTAYELGAKLTMFNRRVQANVAGFYYDYTDKQISTYFADPIYTALARLDNVPNSEAYGIEADVTVRPVNGLTLIGTALWLRTRINGYVGTNAAGQTEDFDGAEFIYSPRFQASMTALVDLPMTDSLNFTAMGNARYQGRSHTIFEQNPLYDIDAYTTVNASVGVRAANDSWSLNVWGRNLFNEYYWNAVASNANVVVRFPGQTRTFGATFSTRF